MCSTTCTTTPRPNKLNNCYHTTTKNLTNNPREIFLNQPDGLFRMLTYVVIIHIGVGSNVVCSTIPGNAKSSVRGIDNKEIPTLEPKLIS